MTKAVTERKPKTNMWAVKEWLSKIDVAGRTPGKIQIQNHLSWQMVNKALREMGLTGGGRGKRGRVGISRTEDGKNYVWIRSIEV